MRPSRVLGAEGNQEFFLHAHARRDAEFRPPREVAGVKCAWICSRQCSTPMNGQDQPTESDAKRLARTAERPVIRSVGIVSRPRRADIAAVVPPLLDWLAERGINVVLRPGNGRLPARGQRRACRAKSCHRSRIC